MHLDAQPFGHHSYLKGKVYNLIHNIILPISVCLENGPNDFDKTWWFTYFWELKFIALGLISRKSRFLPEIGCH